MKYLKIFIYTTIATIINIDTALAFGSSQSSFLENIQPDELGIGADTKGEFFLNRMANMMLSYLAVVLLVAFIYGGFLYLTASLNDSQAEKGKKILMGAVIGFVIITASYALVNTVLFGIYSMFPI